VQWFGRNQIYLKLKLETWVFMPGIKNGMRRAMIDIKMGDALENYFFSEGNQIYLFYNFNTGPHGATFITFSNFFEFF
jgi:hypothetical protein